MAMHDPFDHYLIASTGTMAHVRDAHLHGDMQRLETCLAEVQPSEMAQARAATGDEVCRAVLAHEKLHRDHLERVLKADHGPGLHDGLRPYNVTTHLMERHLTEDDGSTVWLALEVVTDQQIEEFLPRADGLEDDRAMRAVIVHEQLHQTKMEDW